MKFLKAGNRVSPRTCGLQPVALAVVASLMFAGAASASAQTLTTLANFNGANGANPYLYGSLIADAKGNLFGTTADGGASGYGTVFEIAKTTTGYSAASTVLVSFDGSDGRYPFAGLLADANGNLFGTTGGGGTSNAGTVFELAKDATTATGYAAAPTVLVSFDGSDGESPYSSLIVDAKGNLFGTTTSRGASGYGTVFEITKDPNSTTGYASTPITLVSFDGSDGAFPSGGLLADSNGDLFGTTKGGGAFGVGTVFEIAKDAATATGYAATPTVLVSFDGSDGAYPYAAVIADANGDLFGTTESGGPGYDPPNTQGYGTVFEVAKDPNSTTGYASTPTALISFDVSDGGYPFAGLLSDANGDLFGTTAGGGPSDFGTVFEIAKTTTGYSAAPTVLVSFARSNGAVPYAGLIADANGDLFGATNIGGLNDKGTVFEITGSGFVPPTQFAGKPGSANCIGKSISALAQKYGGIAHAAPALGYGSVTALQTAVAGYCGR